MPPFSHAYIFSENGKLEETINIFTVKYFSMLLFFLSQVAKFRIGFSHWPLRIAIITFTYLSIMAVRKKDLILLWRILHFLSISSSILDGKMGLQRILIYSLHDYKDMIYIYLYDGNVIYIVILINDNIKACRRVDLATSSLHLHKRFDSLRFQWYINI